MKKQILIITLIAILSEIAYPLMRANPVQVTPEGEFRVSGEYSRDARYIKYDVGDNMSFISNRYILKPSLSVSYSPLIEAYLLVGAADLNREKTSYYLDDYNGSFELAGGLGAKFDLTGVDLDYYGNYRLNFYADVRYFKTRSIGEVEINDTRVRANEHYFQKDVYDWNEYSLSFYASLKYIDWQNFMPYLGIEWFYFDATYKASRFVTSYDALTESTVRTNLSDEDGEVYFNDPQQWPKVVIGTDLTLKSGMVLSIEAIIWSKKATSVSIGASHISKKDEGAR